MSTHTGVAAPPPQRVDIRLTSEWAFDDITMFRFRSNQKKTFSASVAASGQETAAALRQRRADMDQAWDAVDEGWQSLHQRRIEIGITKPSPLEEDMVRLNVGGAHLNVGRSVLEGTHGLLSSGGSLGNLFEATWDSRQPRDQDGRVVLDENSACVKHLVHSLLTTGSAAEEKIGSVFATEEKSYLLYIARALRLPTTSVSPIGMVVHGGSTILPPGEIGPLTATMQGWCPGKPGKLELLYRASRDGWDGAKFHAKCDKSESTITFFQVGHGHTATVVGGFSAVSWELPPIDFRGSTTVVFHSSPGAFIFLLKDGGTSCQPTKWGVREGYGNKAVARGYFSHPQFGTDDMRTVIDYPKLLLYTGNATYNIPSGSAFLQLRGRPLSEIEVFRVCPQASVGPQDNTASFTPPKINNPTLAGQSTNEDVRSFGALIAGSLMEERAALHQAEAELSRAESRTAACAAAFVAVYGPNIAAAKEDPVVELSVRGTRMTTLRSTLQACPDSALAARFDDQKWPATEKDVDGNGRWKIDCSPSAFSKVLDVLRVIKRSDWIGASSKQSGTAKATVRVAVKASDRASFEEFVHMYFPGRESFLTDHVDFLEESKATT